MNSEKADVLLHYSSYKLYYFFLKKNKQNTDSVELLGCNNHYFIEVFICLQPLQSQAYSLIYVYKSSVDATSQTTMPQK